VSEVTIATTMLMSLEQSEHLLSDIQHRKSTPTSVQWGSFTYNVISTHKNVFANFFSARTCGIARFMSPHIRYAHAGKTTKNSKYHAEEKQ